MMAKYSCQRNGLKIGSNFCKIAIKILTGYEIKYQMIQAEAGMTPIFPEGPPKGDVAQALIKMWVNGQYQKVMQAMDSLIQKWMKGYPPPADP